MDGGAQVMIFVLSFAVFGASGKERPFPSVRATSIVSRHRDQLDTNFLFSVQWAGNPARGRVDYCNGNGALDG